MIDLLRAEFRKLLTVRSTYIISALAFLLVGFLAFYIAGYNSAGANPLWLSNIIGDVSTTIGIFVALVAILLMCHEYRHNTIMYTLTSSNSRTKVLLAKVLVVMAFMLGFTILIGAFAVLMYRLGVAFSPRAIYVTPQFFWSDVWHAVFYLEGYTLTGLVLAALFRHVAGVIAALFIIPIVEQLLGILLKANAKYLPFTVLEQVSSRPSLPADEMLLSAGQAASLFTLYLAVVWFITWYLFLRRDAN